MYIRRFRVASLVLWTQAPLYALTSLMRSIPERDQSMPEGTSWTKMCRRKSASNQCHIGTTKENCIMLVTVRSHPYSRICDTIAVLSGASRRPETRDTPDRYCAGI